MYVSAAQLANRYGVSRTTIWRWIKKRQFPKSVQLGPNTTRWLLTDVERWESQQSGATA